MPNRVEDLFKLKDDLLSNRNIIVSYSILVVLKDIYRDPTVKFFYYDRIVRSKILKSANSLFKFIVINKRFEDYFGSRAEFYKAVEFIFIHLNMSRMITFYKNPDLTIPKPNIENAYVRINVKRFNILNRRISDNTFRVISPEKITTDLTKSQERHLLVFQALMILNELVADRVTIKETHYVYNNPKLKKVIGNKYKLKALNMLSKNMIVHRVVTGAGKRIICIKEGKKKKVSEDVRFNKRIANMSHVHSIQEKKVTIKAFNKLKSVVYKLDRDNVGQYLIFDNIEPNKTIDLDKYL
jgi:hypothetical protein